MSALATALEPLDEAVYGAARAICAEGAILGGSHALDASATFATARGIRLRLEAERQEVRVTAAAVTAAIRKLVDRGVLERVKLVRRYKTRRPRRVPEAGYVVVGEL